MDALHAVCAHPELLAAVVAHLTHADARRLAGACRAAREALATHAAYCSRANRPAFLPRLFVACSAACQLVEIPLDPSSRAGPARVAPLHKPSGAASRRRRRRGGSIAAGADASAAAAGDSDWPTSLAFGSGNARLFVCQHAFDGVAVLEPRASLAPPPPPLAPGAAPRRSSARRRPAAWCGAAAAADAVPALRALPRPKPRLLLQYPEGLALAANGWLYAVTSNGVIAQLPAGPEGGAPLSCAAVPDDLCPPGRRLVPWGMAAWPRAGPGGARLRAAAAAGGPAGAPAASAPGAGPAAARAPHCLYIAVDLDYEAGDYTHPPPPGLSDGAAPWAPARFADGRAGAAPGPEAELGGARSWPAPRPNRPGASIQSPPHAQAAVTRTARTRS
jgi:hypothetical protein